MKRTIMVLWMLSQLLVIGVLCDVAAAKEMYYTRVIVSKNSGHRVIVKDTWNQLDTVIATPEAWEFAKPGEVARIRIREGWLIKDERMIK